MRTRVHIADDHTLVAEGLRAGTTDLVAAIRTVAAGDRYLSATVAPHRDDASPPPSLTTGLTPRQTEVLALIAQGLSGEAIGAALGVAVPTVAFHRQRIREALGLKTEWELVRYAILAKANSGR